MLLEFCTYASEGKKYIFLQNAFFSGIYAYAGFAQLILQNQFKLDFLQCLSIGIGSCLHIENKN